MRRSFLLLAAVILGLSALTGCAGGGSETGSPWWGGGGGGTTQAYSVSGTLRDAISSAPVEGATCTLLQTKGGNFIKDFMRIPKETVTMGTAVTGTDGTYLFTGVPSGTYTLQFTRADYITLEVNDLSVTGDANNVDRTVVKTSQWTQLAGPEYPYDPSKNCLVVEAAPPARMPRVAGVTASITPSEGVMTGYFTDSTPPTIDWNAASSYTNGRMIFYGLTPGVQYSISFSSPGWLFPVLTFTSSGGGGVFQSFGIVATAPNPTPMPTTSPTPTPSPTLSPQPSPSPTQSPGGGGGGGPTLTGVQVTSDREYMGHRMVPAKLGDNGDAEEEQFTATAVYSDGSKKDVTAFAIWSATKWDSADDATAGSVSDAAGTKGKFTATGKKYIEADEIKAAYGGKEGSKKLVVGIVEVPGITADNYETVNLRLGTAASYNERTLIEKINAFYAGQYEVTNAEYCEFLNEVSEGGSKNPIEDTLSWWQEDGDALYNGIELDGEVYKPKGDFSARPVVFVSWYGAVAYCNWLTEKHSILNDKGTPDYCYGPYKRDFGEDRWGLNGANYYPDRKGYRLATEAEWEYACRNNGDISGVSATNYFWGNELDNDEDDGNWKYLWFAGNSDNNHHDVGGKLPNGIGLYDMSGNVYEWVSDWIWDDSFPYNDFGGGSATENPKGHSENDMDYNRGFRGGCYIDSATWCTSECRTGNSPWEPASLNLVGFRIVRTK